MFSPAFTTTCALGSAFLFPPRSRLSLKSLLSEAVSHSSFAWSDEFWFGESGVLSPGPPPAAPTGSCAVLPAMPPAAGTGASRVLEAASRSLNRRNRGGLSCLGGLVGRCLRGLSLAGSNFRSNFGGRLSAGLGMNCSCLLGGSPSSGLGASACLGLH